VFAAPGDRVRVNVTARYLEPVRIGEEVARQPPTATAPVQQAAHGLQIAIPRHSVLELQVILKTLAAVEVRVRRVLHAVDQVRGVRAQPG
jgi:hypothetical protein